MTKLSNFLKKINREGIKIWQALEKDCKPFIKEMDKTGIAFTTLFQRGMGKNISVMKKFTTRKDRQPVDTPLYLHEAFDKAFNEIFGWKVRSQGVFTSSNVSSSSHYGIPYIFFPAGKFKFVWSRSIKDLYFFLDRRKRDFYLPDKDDMAFRYANEYGEGKDGHWEYNGEKITDGFVPEEMAKQLAQEWIGDNELFRWAMLEWIPRISFEDFVEEILEEFNQKVKETVKNKFQDTDLKGALLSGNETIFKCDYYYLINTDYAYYIQKQFGQMGKKDVKIK